MVKFFFKDVNDHKQKKFQIFLPRRNFCLIERMENGNLQLEFKVELEREDVINTSGEVTGMRIRDRSEIGTKGYVLEVPPLILEKDPAPFVSWIHGLSNQTVPVKTTSCF